MRKSILHHFITNAIVRNERAQINYVRKCHVPILSIVVAQNTVIISDSLVQIDGAINGLARNSLALSAKDWSAFGKINCMGRVTEVSPSGPNQNSILIRNALV